MSQPLIIKSPCSSFYQDTYPACSAAMLHISTVPQTYFQSKYKTNYLINMDRGGFGYSPEGAAFGCVFDGVSAGGAVNAYAAQAFTSYCLEWLKDHHRCVTSTALLLRAKRAARVLPGCPVTSFQSIL